MASLSSSILLLVALGVIAREAVGRLLAPVPVAGATVIVVAGVGVTINTATALLFMRGRKHDLNIRGAFLHMAADAAVSLGVVFAGIIIMFRGWVWVDPVLSLVIVGILLVGTWGLLRDSMRSTASASRTPPSRLRPVPTRTAACWTTNAACNAWPVGSGLVGGEFLTDNDSH
jgi:cobalt-zinc-cadmium efflux system protein